MAVRWGTGLSVAMAVLAVESAAAASAWRGTWEAAPTAALASALDLPPGWASPILQNQTIVQDVRISAGGARLRLRLSNEFGDRPLRIGRAAVELIDDAGAPVAGSRQVVTFGDGPSAILPVHAALLSEPVALPTAARSRLRVSLYLPGDAYPCTCHSDGRARASISPPGDFVGRTFAPVQVTTARAFLTGVEVESASPAPVIVTLGDSITDGYMSTVGADRRWPDRLAQRLAPGGGAVVNAGIGGNRLLTDDALPVYGPNALARFDRDVLGVAGATHLVVLEGINDIGGNPNTPAKDLIAAYRQIIERAHAHGLKVILGTLMPFEGAPYFTADGEALRKVVNTWIRTQALSDGVIDFDAIMRNPAHPDRLRQDLQSGDWLHPNDAGYRTMADAIDLRLFH